MTIKHTLRPDQAANVARILAEPTHAALLGDDMGKGKTLQAVEFALQGGFERVLIVGVKDTFAQWAERLDAQSDGVRQLLRVDASKAGKAAFSQLLAGEPGFFFAGSQYLTAQDWDHIPVDNPDGSPAYVVDKETGEPTSKRITERKHSMTYKKMAAVDAIIFDEVHMVANRKSVGIRTLRTIKSDWRLGMSGTWVGNRFENAHAITRWLWPNVIPANFYLWRTEWCAMKQVYVSGGVTKDVVKGEMTPGKFVTTLPCYIRAEADEQPPAPKLLHVDLSPKQREQYEDLERDLLVWLKSHNGPAPLVAELPITLRSRLRTATLGEMVFDAEGGISFDMDSESSKLAALRGILDYYGEQPVAIYTDSKRFAKVTVARMRAAGYNAVEWSGDVSSKDRDEIKRAFLAREVQYIVAVIPAFSTGLDGFQTVCSKIIWLSESENQTLNAQATARFFRPGRVGEFEHVKIIARNTHDVGIFSSLVAQALNMGITLRVAA